jgi:hypothetical protein
MEVASKMAGIGTSPKQYSIGGKVPMICIDKQGGT